MTPDPVSTQTPPALEDAAAILFDLDGVLVDSTRPIVDSINHALRAHGLVPQGDERLAPRIGDRLHGLFVELLAEQGADPGLAATCVLRYRERYRAASLADTAPVPGMAGVLAALGRRRPLGVATAKPVEFAGPILERVRLAGYFRVVAGPPLAAPTGEPKSRIAWRALAALGLAAGVPAALVGDRRHDVEAARSLSLAPVGALWGSGSAAELEAAGAAFLVRRPEDLLALFGEEG